jgi:hypothetical protein
MVTSFESVFACAAEQQHPGLQYFWGGFLAFSRKFFHPYPLIGVQDAITLAENY